jgi:cytochrome c553
MKNAKFNILLILIVSVLGISNCSSPTVSEARQSESNHKSGKEFIANNCLSCHSPTAQPDERLAPPLFALRKHYLEDHPEESAFVSAMLDFLRETNIEKAKMPHAVEKFGLMPQMSFPEDELKNALVYLFENEQEKPKHKEATDLEGKERDRALEQGKSLALKTKKALGKNLMNALAVGGSAYAVEFCSLNAIAITDSMEELLGAARIKRVSDLNRNPNNAASANELIVLNQFKKTLALGDKASGDIKRTEEGWRVFHPIITNQMCLQCHGDKLKEINTETLDKVAAKYPQDLAIGYKINELRGMWVVDFPNDF